MVLEARKVAGFVGVCQCSESEMKKIVSSGGFFFSQFNTHTL